MKNGVRRALRTHRSPAAAPSPGGVHARTESRSLGHPSSRSNETRMKIIDLYRERFVVSFEIFPTENSTGRGRTQAGARGSFGLPAAVYLGYLRGRRLHQEKTLELALRLRDTLGILPLVHFTCVGAGRAEIRRYLDEIRKNGIEKHTGLRGDPPKGEARSRRRPTASRTPTSSSRSSVPSTDSPSGWPAIPRNTSKHPTCGPTSTTSNARSTRGPTSSSPSCFTIMRITTASWTDLPGWASPCRSYQVSCPSPAFRRSIGSLPCAARRSRTSF